MSFVSMRAEIMLKLFLCLTFQGTLSELVYKTNEGANVLLSCSTAPGTSVTWLYRGQWTEGDRYMCITGSVLPDYTSKLKLTGSANGDYTLTIRNVVVNDSGVYTCTEDDGLGQKTSVRLDVHRSDDGNGKLPVETSSGNIDYATANHSVQTEVHWVVAIVCLLIVVIASVSVNVVVMRRICIRRDRKYEKRLIGRQNGRKVGPIRVLVQGRDEIIGVARIYQQLILLRRREKNHLQFYSATDFRLQREISVPRLNVDKWYNDMVVCVDTLCLYISDQSNSCIHRVPVAESDVSKPKSLSVSKPPRSLSSTADHQLLVTYRDENKLQELNSTDGKVEDEILLLALMKKPWHAIKLSSTGQYVVSHGLRRRRNSNVSIVNKDGTIVLSYNRETSSLNEPYHLAVDWRGFIFVTDYRNDRVLVLDGKLKYVRHLKSNELRKPYRLCVDNSTHQLYIGQWNGTLTYAELQREDGQNTPAAV